MLAHGKEGGPPHACPLAERRLADQVRGKNREDADDDSGEADRHLQRKGKRHEETHPKRLKWRMRIEVQGVGPDGLPRIRFGIVEVRIDEAPARSPVLDALGNRELIVGQGQGQVGKAEQEAA